MTWTIQAAMNNAHLTWRYGSYRNVFQNKFCVTMTTPRSKVMEICLFKLLLLQWLDKLLVWFFHLLLLFCYIGKMMLFWLNMFRPDKKIIILQTTFPNARSFKRSFICVFMAWWQAIPWTNWWPLTFTWPSDNLIRDWYFHQVRESLNRHQNW